MRKATDGKADTSLVGKEYAFLDQSTEFGVDQGFVSGRSSCVVG
jgi:hypothetical protein